MNKILAFLLVSAMMLGICGCASSGKSSVESPFTDDFFSDVVKISGIYPNEVTGEQMKPVISYLKSLKLKETDEHLSATDENGDALYGPTAITFEKSNGTKVTYLCSTGRLTCTDEPRRSYDAVDYNEDSDEDNIILKLQNAVDEGLSSEK